MAFHIHWINRFDRYGTHHGVGGAPQLHSARHIALRGAGELKHQQQGNGDEKLEQCSGGADHSCAGGLAAIVGAKYVIGRANESLLCSERKNNRFYGFEKICRDNPSPGKTHRPLSPSEVGGHHQIINYILSFSSSSTILCHPGRSFWSKMAFIVWPYIKMPLASLNLCVKKVWEETPEVNSSGPRPIMV